MLVKHIQTVTHSNIEIDLYEEIEDIVYDYVTENNKNRRFPCGNLLFYLMIYLLHVQINLGIKHKVLPIPIHFGKFTSRFSCASTLRFVLLRMLVLTCNVPYSLHMYQIDPLFQKVCIYLPGLIAVT